MNTNCGCNSTLQYSTTPQFAAQGQLMCDSRYFSLPSVGSLQLLGIPQGSNCQAFLTGANGLVVLQGGVATVRAVPVLNAAVSGSFPVPAGFGYLIGGNNSDPSTWYSVAAPTGGTYILQSVNGSWMPVDASSLPGLDAIGTSATFASKLNILGIVETDPGVFVARKLTVVHKAPIVGDIDGDGIAGYKLLPTTDFFEHPKIKATEFVTNTYKQSDVDGNSVADGLLLATVTGGGAVTDGARVWYSPSEEKFYRAAAKTNKFYPFTNVVASSPGNVPLSWVNIPGGHLVTPSLPYNYPTVRIDADIKFAATESVELGIFRDGNLRQSFKTNADKDAVIAFIDEDVPLGNHVYDVRWQRSAGATAATVNYSCIIVQSLD